jgi:hypothetical protein
MPTSLRLIAAAGALSLHGQPAQAADDPALHGCWRSQQVQLSYANRSPHNTNGDCVVQYDGTRARSLCHSTTAESDITSTYESIGPGLLRITPVDSATGKPTAPPAELRYRIDGDWLLTTRQFSPAAPAGGAAGEPPRDLAAVSIRVAASGDKAVPCKPRGDTGLRSGRLSYSSLALSVPAGWEPWLVEPTTDHHLRQAINTSLFVGAFVPRGEARTSPAPPRLVLVLDDVRFGPSPVRSAEFVEVKKRFIRELGSATLGCDLPDRACALLKLPDGGLVYSELFHISGRVAFVSSTVAAPQPGSERLLQDTVRVFVQQLRSNNSP